MARTYTKTEIQNIGRKLAEGASVPPADERAWRNAQQMGLTTGTGIATKRGADGRPVGPGVEPPRVVNGPRRNQQAPGGVGTYSNIDDARAAAEARNRKSAGETPERDEPDLGPAGSSGNAPQSWTNPWNPKETASVEKAGRLTKEWDDGVVTYNHGKYGRGFMVKGEPEKAAPADIYIPGAGIGAKPTAAQPPQTAATAAPLQILHGANRNNPVLPNGQTVDDLLGFLDGQRKNRMADDKGGMTARQMRFLERNGDLFGRWAERFTDPVPDGGELYELARQTGTRRRLLSAISDTYAGRPIRAADGAGVTDDHRITVRDPSGRITFSGPVREDPAKPVMDYVAKDAGPRSGFTPNAAPARSDNPSSFDGEDAALRAALHSFDPKVRAAAQADVDQSMQRSFMQRGLYTADGTMIAPTANPVNGFNPMRERHSDLERRRAQLDEMIAGGGKTGVVADDKGGVTEEYIDSLQTDASRGAYDDIQTRHFAKTGAQMDHSVAVIRSLLGSGTIDRDRAKELAWKLRERRDRALAETMAKEHGGKASDYYVKTAKDDVMVDRETLAAKYNAIHQGDVAAAYRVDPGDGSTLQAMKTPVSARQMDFLARRHGLKVADETVPAPRPLSKTRFILPDDDGWIPTGDENYSYRYVKGLRQPVFRDNRLFELDLDDVSRHPDRYVDEIATFRSNPHKAQAYADAGETDWQRTYKSGVRDIPYNPSDRVPTGRKVLSARKSNRKALLNRLGRESFFSFPYGKPSEVEAIRRAHAAVSEIRELKGRKGRK